MNSPTKAEELYQLLKRHAVTREFWPLAIGAKEEIQAAFPEFALEDVAMVLRRHCKHGKYLTALVKGEQRFHLNGEPAGAIKQLHKDKAAALLETQKKRRAAREQALKAPPKKVEPKAFEPPKPKPQITAAAPKTPDQISSDVSGTRPKLTLKKKGGAAMSTHLHTITNEEFISVVFRDAPQDAVPWVTGFKEDPISVDGKHWAGAPVTNCTLPGMIDKESNNFMVISTFYRKEEVQRGQRVMRYRRRKENFAACHLIMIDDVGTKMQPWQIPLEPSYKLETSPGNYQYGYLLAAPGLDGDLVARVVDAMVAQGLTADGKDPGMKGVTRYGRLPVGWNTKAKYVERLGAPFVHQLEEWHPDRRFTLQEIIEAFELDLDRVKGKASAQTDDPILKALESRGLLKGQISGKEGVWGITCPWLDEHTDRADIAARLTSSRVMAGGWLPGLSVIMDTVRAAPLKTCSDYSSRILRPLLRGSRARTRRKKRRSPWLQSW